MRLVRDLGRRKLRSGLTITGIAVGIMALVVFGSMANKMNALISGGSKYYADKAVVSVGSMYSGNIQPLSLADVAKIAKIDGVAAATPTVDMMLSTTGWRHDGHPGDDHCRRPRRRQGLRDLQDRYRAGPRRSRPPMPTAK